MSHVCFVHCLLDEKRLSRGRAGDAVFKSARRNRGPDALPRYPRTDRRCNACPAHRGASDKPKSKRHGAKAQDGPLPRTGTHMRPSLSKACCETKWTSTTYRNDTARRRAATNQAAGKTPDNGELEQTAIAGKSENNANQTRQRAIQTPDTSSDALGGNIGTCWESALECMQTAKEYNFVPHKSCGE